MTIFWIIVVGIFGLVLGSFMNVLIVRLPKGESIVAPSSFCRSCGAKVRSFDNIPVLSYIILKGRCRKCREKISLLYPITEILTCVLFIILYLKFGFSILLLKYIILCYILLAVGMTDITTAFGGEFETGVIPQVYPFIGVIIGLAFAFYAGEFTEALAGAAAGYLILAIPGAVYAKIRGFEGLGEGDMTLFAMIGVYTGLASVPFVLTVAACFGVFAGIIIIAVKKNARFAIPFAPMLAFGAIIYIFIK